MERNDLAIPYRGLRIIRSVKIAKNMRNKPNNSIPTFKVKHLLRIKYDLE